MKVVVQLVRRASVSIEGQIVSSIGKGYLLLVGLAPGDDIRIAQKMADKIVKLRVFPDENGKTNLSIKRTLPPPAKPQSSRPQNRSYGSAPRSSAPNDRSAAPRNNASAPAQPQQKSFDDMLKQFMTESSSKMSSIKQYSEHKTKTRRR